jgi:hypothetical protein
MNNIITKIQLVEGPVDGYLNVKEDVSVPLNFAISDIREVENRTGSFSKTIVLAGDKNNNQLLNNYFEVNIEAGTFDVNKRHKCVVLQNNIPILENAYIRLLSVTKVQNTYGQDDRVEYQIQVRDSIGDFFKEINNRELSDLDFSEFNHTYNAQNVIDSFDHTWEDGYKYVMPYIDDNQYYLTECFPGIYAKQYFDRIHDQAGYEYEWDSFSADTVQFDKLIIPFNGDIKKLEQDAVDDLEVLANSSSAQTIQNAIYFGGGGFLQLPSSYEKIVANVETKDNYGYYNPSTSQYTNTFVLQSPDFLSYQVDIEWELVVQNNNAFNVWYYTNQDSKRFRGYVCLANPTQPNNLVSATGLNPNWNNSTKTSISAGSTVVIPGSSNQFSPGETIVSSGSSQNLGLSISNLSVGNLVELGGTIEENLDLFGLGWRNASTGAAVTNVRILFRVKSVSIRITPSVESFGFNYPVILQNFAPKKIKQSEFLKSIYRMYNLYIEIDKEKPNRLIYKSRDEYYDDGKLVDWTKKLAKNEKQDLIFIPELSSKKMVLTYKQDDKDYLQKAYIEETGEVYGQVEVTFDNESVKGVDTKELIFSPTLNLWTNFGTNNPVWETFSPKNNIRILLDNGEQSCGYYSIQNYAGNSVQVNTYPFISMLDRPENPLFDIAFGICDFYPYNVINPTANNLYTNFWRRTLAQINTGKLMIAYFDLNETDIFKMALSDKIRINNSYWHINKIIDYNANKAGLTKVELISIDDDLKLPRFGRNVRPVLPGVPVKPDVPVKPVGPVRPIIGAVKEIIKLRSFNSSVNDSPYDYINMGKGNIITNDFTGIIATNEVFAKYPGLYFGNVRLDENGVMHFTKGLIIDGGQDVVFPFGKTNPVDIIDGGRDSKRNIGGYKTDRPIIDTNKIN